MAQGGALKRPALAPAAPAPTPRAAARILPWSQVDAAWQDRWLELWRRTGASPDLSPMWAAALVAGHGVEPADLYVLVAGPAEQPSLVWPFQLRSQRHRLGFRVRWVAPLQNAFCMHSGLLTTMSSADACRAIVATLRAWSSPWDWIDVAALEAGSALHAAWRRATAGRASYRRAIPGERPPYIASPGSFTTFLDSRSPGFRKKARAQLRELQTDTSLRLRVYTTADEMPAFLGEVLEIERLSWKHAAGQAISSRGWELGFYRHLLASMAPLQCVSGAVLYVDGQPAAHSIDLVHADRVYGLKSSYDARYADRSVGALLLTAMAARYFDRGCAEYDFLGTGEPYKLSWTSQARQHFSFVMYQPTVRGAGIGLLHSLAETARRRRSQLPTAARTPRPSHSRRPASVLL